ncbi:MAG TPA: HAMP domain-containing sensor histidine kinase, partial [Kofleriaceae bacterium]|nr:HAMP domain-containing sensor histidine kinase [Kofleriaceae bacterium]
EGTSVTPERLRNKKERIDWADFCAIKRNLRPHFTDDELVEVGRSYLRTPGLRFAFVIARLLLSAMDFYRWFSKPRQGVGNQMFTCIVPTHREPAENEIELDLELPEGYEVCWEFFLVSKGNVEELPRLLGLPRAKVTLTRIPRGGRYHIKVPQGTPALTRVWRFFTWPFAVRAAARELREAHETLQERYEELETARAKLDTQATRLRTAHTISDLIHHDLDLERTLKRIAQAIVQEAGFEWSQITSSSPSTSAQFGTDSGAPRLARSLTAGDREIGRLEVVPQTGAEPAERQELLAFLEPTLAMALQNAIAYRELAEYKVGLEKIVEERTAELRQARDLLAGSVEQLREAQEAREKFFANISHEIRTPLSLILLAAGDVEKRAGHLMDDRARSGLVAVTDAARKLLRLVDELLILAAGQADKFVLSREPTNLAALFEHIVAAWRPAAEAAGLTFDARGPAKLFAQVDPVAIERLASNLLSNAVKYTPKGGRVEVELVANTDGVRLSVLDTGPGIDPSLQARLFGRFERAHSDDRRKAGTGIGLALVKQLVEAHDGTVAALPRASGGTEFRVELPASIVIDEGAPLPPTFLRTTHAPAVAPAVASGMVFTPTGLSNGTILIAEDEPRLADLVARLLSDEYTVVVALDGNTALELVQRHQPQLLITDVDMPGMNGIELSRRFREITGDRLAPIIILSAVLDLRTRIAGLEAGAIDYIGKPFDPTELRARVQAQFRMRDLALRLHRAEQLSALGILTAGLAHELRNPANGIVNAIPPLMELLPKELTGPDTGPGQLFEVMKGCADHIAFLTRQLLGFRNNAQLELRPAVLSELVNRAVKLAKGALAGVDMRVDVAVASPVLCAAPLLVQVLTNLIENAGHASGPGGWVEVAARASGGRITVEVADSGPGVPVELHERVFEPFFTTKAPGVGTGLGLSLARNIVHRHGGVLEIRQRGATSVFVIELNAESDLAPSVNAV